MWDCYKRPKGEDKFRFDLVDFKEKKLDDDSTVQSCNQARFYPEFLRLKIFCMEK